MKSFLLVLVLGFAFSGWADNNRFVAPQGAHRAPFASWADAATNVQAALDVAVDGDTVWVADGFYAGAEVIVGRSVTLKSLNGPGKSILKSAGAHRVMSILTNAVVEGFTITGGAASHGGGVKLTAGTLRNCQVVSNSASVKGGGVHCYFGGRVEDCLIAGNRLVGNDGGGGVCCEYGGVLLRCTIRGNYASQRGGGVYCDRGFPEVRNCLITENASRYGGGIMFFTTGGAQYQAGYAESCLIARNTAELKGGGGYGNLGGDFYNCTIVENTASNSGGGVYFLSDTFGYGICANTVIYDNLAPAGMNHYNAGAYFFSCCTVPANGANGVTEAPEFRNRWQGDYRLAASSPCIGAGDPLWADLAGLDLDGRSRLSGDGLEIGAYEYQPEQSPVDSDSDGDGLCDAEELIAGTDPQRADSVFRVESLASSIAMAPLQAGDSSSRPLITLRWASVEGRSYTIWRSTDLRVGFEKVQIHLIATPPENIFQDSLDQSSSAFYRISVE